MAIADFRGGVQTPCDGVRDAHLGNIVEGAPPQKIHYKNILRLIRLKYLNYGRQLP